MAADGDSPQHPAEDDTLPDEREIIADRIGSLEDESSHLSVEEVADELDIELE